MLEANKYTFISYALALLGLYAVLELGLLTALLAGLLVYQLVDFGSRVLERRGVSFLMSRALLLFLLAAIVVTAFTLGIAALTSQVSGEPENLAALLQKMADVVDTGRSHLPLWAQEYLPSNVAEWQVTASEWLRENASRLRVIGRDVGLFFVYLIIGMVIGGLVAISPDPARIPGPLAQALIERMSFLRKAFKRIVFSQVRISALNTTLTAIFLTLVMPALGAPLPLTKTMIAVTFIAGLLPIIGNLISNTVIFLVGLSVSMVAAIGALVFLIVLHKLEYFVNAHIIGTRIRSNAWELLIAMTVMEAAFGIPGLVAAPIYYAYIKDELSARQWI